MVMTFEEFVKRSETSLAGLIRIAHQNHEHLGPIILMSNGEEKDPLFVMVNLSSVDDESLKFRHAIWQAAETCKAIYVSRLVEGAYVPMSYKKDVEEKTRSGKPGLQDVPLDDQTCIAAFYAEHCGGEALVQQYAINGNEIVLPAIKRTHEVMNLPWPLNAWPLLPDNITREPVARN